MADIAPEYVAARSVLLDALTALEYHLDNVILVGAQAVYHHTGDTTLNVPVMTTDADLALDINQLSDQPKISSVLEHAGFAQGDNPGHWVGRGDVAVDLMVVPHQSGTDRKHARGARIAPMNARPHASQRGWSHAWSITRRPPSHRSNPRTQERPRSGSPVLPHC